MCIMIVCTVVILGCYKTQIKILWKKIKKIKNSARSEISPLRACPAQSKAINNYGGLNRKMKNRRETVHSNVSYNCYHGNEGAEVDFISQCNSSLEKHRSCQKTKHTKGVQFV